MPTTETTCVRVLCVVGTLGHQSATHATLGTLADQLRALGLETDVFTPATDPLPLFSVEHSHKSPEFPALKERVDRADVIVLGTPDYHGSMSGVLKNFLDHFWREFTGKLFVQVVVSHEKGLTVLDQMRTVARQCYAWSLPYGISVDPKAEIQEGNRVSDALQRRLEMLAHDIRTYGTLLAIQRDADLRGTAPGFLARLRTPR